MKSKGKIWKIIAFIILGSVAKGEEVTIEDLLKKLETTSYEKEIYKITEEKLNSVEKVNELGNYNGIKAEVTTDYDIENKVYDIEGAVYYGDFYIKGSKEDFYNSQNIIDQDTKVAFGVNKNINDMIYSSYDSELNKNKLDKEIQKNYFRDTMEDEKIALINLYEEYKTNEFEIKLKESNLEGIITEEKTMQRSYELGAVPKIDLDALSITRANLEIEIETSKRKLESIKKQFLYDFSIDISKNTLKELNANSKELDNFINNIGSRDIESIAYEMEKTKENIKYEEYQDKYPQLSVGAEHIKETVTNGTPSNERENRVYLTISKNLFTYNNNLETEKLNLSQYEIEFNQTKDSVMSERLQVEETYNEYYKTYITSKNDAEYEKSKYEIAKLEYKLGEIKYTEVIDAFDDYLADEVLAEKAKNTLNGYIYEIMVRGEKND